MLYVVIYLHFDSANRAEEEEELEKVPARSPSWEKGRKMGRITGSSQTRSTTVCCYK